MRKYMNVFTVKTSPAKGGGITGVEEKSNMSVKEMFTRMLMKGELSEASRVKGVNVNSQERAVKLMKEAKEAPKYLREGDVYNELKKLKVLEKNIREENKLNDEKEKAESIAKNMFEEYKHNYVPEVIKNED